MNILLINEVLQLFNPKNEIWRLGFRILRIYFGKQAAKMKFKGAEVANFHLNML